jgi:hypothetical protein
MKLMSIAALAVALTAIALPAQAAWQSEVTNEVYAIGWVYDSTDKVQLSLECDLFGSVVALLSYEKWDDNEDYPATVPVSVIVDRRMIAEGVFAPENADGYLAIAAYEFEQPGVLDMILAMALAKEDIEVRFLDQTLHFTADNVFSAAADVTYVCNF